VKDRGKQSSSSWYKSLGLITVQGKVVGGDGIIQGEL
jgi:hypothetical protein